MRGAVLVCLGDNSRLQLHTNSSILSKTLAVSPSLVSRVGLHQRTQHSCVYVQSYRLLRCVFVEQNNFLPKKLLLVGCELQQYFVPLT